MRQIILYILTDTWFENLRKNSFLKVDLLIGRLALPKGVLKNRSHLSVFPSVFTSGRPSVMYFSQELEDFLDFLQENICLDNWVNESHYFFHTDFA